MNSAITEIHSLTLLHVNVHKSNCVVRTNTAFPDYSVVQKITDQGRACFLKLILKKNKLRNTIIF